MIVVENEKEVSLIIEEGEEDMEKVAPVYMDECSSQVLQTVRIFILEVIVRKGAKLSL